MRNGLLIDTCALIAYADPQSALHDCTVHYIEQAVRDDVPLFVSTLCVAEFSVRQSIFDLDHRTFIIAPFEEPEAILAGEIEAAIQRDEGDDRVRLKIDLMLIAHAEKLGASAILTADARSLARYCERARAQRLTSVHTVLTTEPFDPVKVLHPASQSLNFGAAPAIQ